MAYKVAVLMGGTSKERSFSLASGKRVCDAFEKAGFEVLPLDTNDKLVDTLRAEKPDVAYIALHGKHGEDGTIESLLEFLHIPYVGSDANACKRTWNKSALESLLNDSAEFAGFEIHCPKTIRLTADAFKVMGAATAIDLIPDEFENGLPLCVKPACQGSALGMSKVEIFDELAPAILTALSYDDEVLISEWVEGVEMAVSIIEMEGVAFALPPVEIVPKEDHIYDTAARLDSDLVDFYAPVRPESLASSEEVSSSIRSEIERTALEAYHAFGLRDFGRIDLIWDGAQTKILECAVSPGMTSSSLFPLAAKAAGMELADVLTVLVNAAVERGA